MLNWFQHLHQVQVDVCHLEWLLMVERNQNHRKPHLSTSGRRPASVQNDNIVVSSSDCLPDGQAVENAFRILFLLHPSTPIGMTNGPQIRWFSSEKICVVISKESATVNRATTRPPKTTVPCGYWAPAQWKWYCPWDCSSDGAHPPKYHSVWKCRTAYHPFVLHG